MAEIRPPPPDPQQAESDPDSAFEHRARLAVLWQDLITPVRAITGYQELIVEQGRQLGLAELGPYFEKVLVAARLLGALVDNLLEPKPDRLGEGADELAGVAARLRHDLRTPLNAIIGYSEIAVEEIQNLADADALRRDIGALLAEARSLLDRIDAIVDLSRTQDADGVGEAGIVVQGLLRTLRAGSDVSRTSEVGHILVVDDSESNRDLLRRRLIHEGHTVMSCRSRVKEPSTPCRLKASISCCSI